MKEEMEQLEAMNRGELLQLWEEMFPGEKPAARGAHLLRRQLAWKLQERESGGVTPRLHRRLLDTAKAFNKDVDHEPRDRPTPQSGTTLTRNWKGTVHTVKVTPDGFIYKGRKYKGLSKIAREITGTRWSGPLFFGLRQPSRKTKASP